ncbi:MAG TPA: 16S rRNA (adenine(1518)-N(6)/adenine(1519)-N(6))-dimethyltransferase RsmA [Phnomibacter sp.]|nr:16S rRNA (adenine(1518)-N(6)/adenine(1519)-N(6))-dimethyltransferase RsmA [Phnomibacter sp.]
MQYTLKKGLGQHFLHEDSVCRRIVGALEPLHPERLLEVGPGGGAITRYLLQLPQVNFKAIEVDAEKVDYLQQTFPALNQAGVLLHQSILEAAPPFEAPFVVIGNFPYNISTEIVFKLLEWGPLVEGVVGMFQKEVAQRLAAPPGSKVYGVTSVLTQAFYSIDYLFDVAPGSFTPPPKVMSGVIRMVPLAAPPAMRSPAHFKNLVKTAFGQRRKQLRNAVRSLFSPEVLANPLFDKRAEQLSVEQFAQLSFKMK